MSAPRGEQAVATTWNLRWKRRPVSVGAAGLSTTDIVIAVALSAVPVLLAAGVIHDGPPQAGVAACLGVIALTLPVAWRRPWPLTAAAVMAVAAVANGLAFGHLVRCGVALPAVFLVAFGIAARVTGWARVAVGVALCAADVVAEGYYDPQISWPGLAADGRLHHPRPPAARTEPDGRGAAGEVGPAAAAARADGPARGPGRPDRTVGRH